MLRLEIEPALEVLAEIFPAAPDRSEEFDYAEPAAPRGIDGLCARARGDLRADALVVRPGARDRHHHHA